MNRSRVNANWTLQGKFTGTWRDAAGTVTPWNGTSPYFDLEYETFNDVSTPRFAELQSKGAIVNSPCSRVTKKNILGTGTRSVTQKSNPLVGGTITGDITGVFRNADGIQDLLYPSSFDDGFAYKRALIRALSTVDSTPYAFMEDLLESKKTLETMRSPIQQALELANKFDHEFRRYSKIYSVARASANAWLLVRNGYSPICRSIMNAHEAMLVGKRTKPSRRRAIGTYEDQESAADTVVKTNGTATRTYKRTAGWTTTGKITILYQDTNPMVTWRDNLGLRVKDVPLGLWQILPLSWMVDRFINVSDSLKAVTNLLDPAITILMACESHRQVYEKSCTLVSETDTTYNISLSGNKQLFTEIYHERKPISIEIKDLMAQPADITQTVFGSFSSTADLLSLVVSKIKR